MHRFVELLRLLPPVCVCAAASLSHADIFSFIVKAEEQNWTSVSTSYGGIYATQIQPSSAGAPITFATGSIIYFNPPAACLGDRDTLTAGVLVPEGIDLTPIRPSTLATLDSIGSTLHIATIRAHAAPISIIRLPNDMTLVDPDHIHEPALTGLVADSVDFTNAPIQASDPAAPDPGVE